MHKKFVEGLLAYLLQRASHQVTSQFHEILKIRDVSKHQWRLLVWLSDGDAYTVTELAHHLMLEQPAATRLINAAAKDDLVTKTTDAADARRTLIAISDKGRSHIARLKEDALVVDRLIAQRYGQKEVERLKKDLLKLIHRFDNIKRT